MSISIENQSLALGSPRCGINKVETISNLTVFIFATIKRSDVKAKPVMKRVTASSYKEARRKLISNYVISFAGRIPAQGVCNA
ncbi:host cell division inhibitor Icd-like protein [Yersinia ruckeri]|uniref:host cell division inhibitor Icd-like protein n=1 Tax=Yersinia ruckeri TaxID=29486 RepID=UPI00211E945E|nr:host cell division inhibitor Icd-like protein [Yersinia ruckeri]MCK8596519.1 host cell division inhibitor Icd-like protein [Yersinia ruckeri]MCK8598016.1 host cell division inhibitor Icd-like protein [Yersinia ruckeri]MDA5502401.1 host cell division inhibitor Icd-like protein [Yersinia ruckeri]MDN0092395.1 host cell division inhibitor Icd-like protein [Yersinia ruckeri]UIM92569.1 host cell division inhibitor Icd-like protein [Yersinia ruckeri]